jgi:hypothetical protein
LELEIIEIIIPFAIFSSYLLARLQRERFPVQMASTPAFDLPDGRPFAVLAKSRDFAFFPDTRLSGRFCTFALLNSP